METNEIPFEAEKTEIPSVDSLWDKIGFHKPIAGFFYNLTFSLIGLLLGLFLTGFIVISSILTRSRTGIGMLRGSFLVVFCRHGSWNPYDDDRFIAEARIKNPGKMLHYYSVLFVPVLDGLDPDVSCLDLRDLHRASTSLSYGVWLMLIVATYQYPGYLGVFSGVLGHYRCTTRPPSSASSRVRASRSSRSCRSCSSAACGHVESRGRRDHGHCIGACIGCTSTTSSLCGCRLVLLQGDEERGHQGA